MHDAEVITVGSLECYIVFPLEDIAHNLNGKTPCGLDVYSEVSRNLASRLLCAWTFVFCSFLVSLYISNATLDK